MNTTYGFERQENLLILNKPTVTHTFFVLRVDTGIMECLSFLQDAYF